MEKNYSPYDLYASDNSENIITQVQLREGRIMTSQIISIIINNIILRVRISFL